MDSTTDTASYRFFDIPELLSHLASTLESPELAALCRCNRRFNSELTPSLYKSIHISGNYMVRGQSILSYTPCLVALGRNIHHTRNFGIGPVELIIYYNCILAFEGLRESHSNSPAILSYLPRWLPPASSSSLPRWLPPADPFIPEVLPLAPATNLQHLCLADISHAFHYKPAGAINDQAMLAILCWLISLNPRLRHLETHYEPKVELAGCRLLAKAVFGLSELTTLDLTLSCPEGQGFQFGSAIFFHCCPSIQKFKLDLTEYFSNDGDDDDNTWWKLSNVVRDADWMVEAKKQESLPSLKELSLWYFGEGIATDDILAIFAHCPNITKLEVPVLFDDYDHNVIGKFIGKECTQLRSLSCGSVDGDDNVDGPLALQIMETLPAQQLESINFYGLIDPLSPITFTHPLRRHSTTLHTIRIQMAGGSTNILLSPIFEECVNLKVLDIPYNCLHIIGLYATLTDLLARPWNSSKLKYLNLGISGCELPIGPESQPYYARPAPIILSQVETDQFGRLEEFYRRLGSLTELEYLSLRMLTLDDEGELDTTGDPTCFPALMSVGDLKTGRPGYLKLLEGLKELRHLLGSIRVDTAESKKTVGMEECLWINSHWPKLQSISCFKNKRTVTKPFKWLQAQRGLNYFE
ncbi:hypothetical protein EC991_008085 [Linnemannia zychae]|nr:hypothetical protein EC991_008085 [Linnemannia zychae]